MQSGHSTRKHLNKRWRKPDILQSNHLASQPVLPARHRASAKLATCHSPSGHHHVAAPPASPSARRAAARSKAVESSVSGAQPPHRLPPPPKLPPCHGPPGPHQAPPPPASRRAAAAVPRGKAVESSVSEAKRLDRLQRLLESQLQPAAREYCRVASWREGTLLLIVTDGH